MTTATKKEKVVKKVVKVVKREGKGMKIGAGKNLE